MRQFHQFFQQPGSDRLKSILGYENASRNLDICWYPSAGQDFRHICYFENMRLTNDTVFSPLLYVHSDMLIKLDISDNLPFVDNEKLTSDIEIGECFEVKPKKLLHHPSDDIWLSGSNQFSGKVFALQLFYHCIYRGRKTRVSIPMIYFGYENLNLLVDFFLANQIYVSTLIHIQDGGASFGGSKIPMNFIYKVSDILKISRVISDESVAQKKFNSWESYEALENQCFKSKNYAIRRFFRPNFINREFNNIFRSQWMENIIPSYCYGRSEYSGYSMQYYDWTRIVSHGNQKKFFSLPNGI